jgi:molybdopterin converting factor small subunit
MPIVTIPAPYRKPTGGLAEVEVSGETVLDCLKAVENRYNGFLAYVLDEKGEAHRFVKLFVNGEQLEARSALATPVSARDRVDVLSAIAGG